MRLAYLSAPVLGLLLVGCGPDDDRTREATPPQPATGQSAPATSAPPSNEGSGAGPQSGSGAPLGTGAQGDMGTAPADNGSGLGTSSGAGTAPNPAPGASGAAQ